MERSERAGQGVFVSLYEFLTQFCHRGLRVSEAVKQLYDGVVGCNELGETEYICVDSRYLRMHVGEYSATDAWTTAPPGWETTNVIERLQAEIKALNDVDKILGTSAPAKPAARRSSARRPAAAATPVAETASDATPARKRRPMTAKEKEAVSERMKASWAARRKKAAK